MGDVKKVAIREKKRVKLTEEEDIFGTDIQEYFRNVEIDFTDKRPPCSNHEGDEGFQLTCPECKTAAGIETSSRRLQSKPAPSSRYSSIAIFVCAMVIIALIIFLCSFFSACASEARLRAAKPRTPSYIEGYTQYRHDSLQRHELLI